MNQMIKSKTVDFTSLVKNNTIHSDLNFQSKLIDELTDTFTDNEQKWYIANLYMYLNYHPTDEFPIDIDDVWKLIGFVNKCNAKRTLENNFVTDEDYKISLLRTEKRSNIKAGLNKERIIKEFCYKLECVNSCNIGNKSLVKALTCNIPYNNYYYKYLDDKLYTSVV